MAGVFITSIGISVGSAESIVGRDECRSEMKREGQMKIKSETFPFLIKLFDLSLSLSSLSLSS